MWLYGRLLVEGLILIQMDCLPFFNPKVTYRVYTIPLLAPVLKQGAFLNALKPSGKYMSQYVTLYFVCVGFIWL
jgi:hypothetical protein